MESLHSTQIRKPKTALWSEPQRLEMPHQLWETARPSDRFRELKCDRQSLPRTVGNMNSFVVAFTALPQRPDNLHPAVGQSPVSAGSGVSFVQLLLEISSGPTRMAQALSCQIVSDIPQGMRAVVAELDRFALATAAGDGHGACHRLQRRCGWKATAVVTNPSQQPSGGQGTFGARKGQPPCCFRMGREDLFDLADQRCFW